MIIFLQDTDEACRTELSRLLQDAGHHVQAAADPSEALGSFQQHYIPLAIFALDPLAADDAALFRQLKEQSPHTLMIIATHNPSLEATIATLRLGAFDYLLLPCQDRELVLKMIKRADDALASKTEQRTRLLKMKELQGALQNANGKLKANGHADDPAELYFHRYFEEAFTLELARSRRYELNFSLISLHLEFCAVASADDADLNFQRHMAAVAEFLKKRLRRSDLFFRSKVDEFLIMLPETPKDGAVIVVDGIRQGIDPLLAPDRPDNLPFPAPRRLSLGTATYPHDGTDSPELLSTARNVTL